MQRTVLALAVATTIGQAQLNISGTALAAENPQVNPPVATRPAQQGAGAQVWRASASLDREQYAAFYAEVQRLRSQSAAVQNKVAAAQKEVVKAALADDFNETEVKARIQTMLRLQEELILVRARAMAALAPSLKAEQREQLVNSTGIGMLTSGAMSYYVSGGGATPPSTGGAQAQQPQVVFEPGGGGATAGYRQWFAGSAYLNQTQREVFNAALDQKSKELAALQASINAAQKALVKAVLSESPDAAALQAQCDEIGRLQSQLLLIRANAMTILGPTLKPDQRTQLENGSAGASMLTGGAPAYGYGEFRQPVVSQPAVSQPGVIRRLESKPDEKAPSPSVPKRP